MNATKPPSYNVISFQNMYNHINPSDLENIIETLEDMGYLSEKGTKFRTTFWKFLLRNEVKNMNKKKAIGLCNCMCNKCENHLHNKCQYRCSENTRLKSEEEFSIIF